MKRIVCMGLVVALGAVVQAQAGNNTSGQRGNNASRPVATRPVNQVIRPSVVKPPLRVVEPIKAPTPLSVGQLKYLQGATYPAGLVQREEPKNSLYPINLASGGGAGNGGGYGGSSSGTPDDWYENFRKKYQSEVNITVPTYKIELDKRYINPNYADTYTCSCCGLVMNRASGHVCARAAACTREQLEKPKVGK